jgi:16S rRNA (uracil1498-N3)-methyltransferase
VFWCDPLPDTAQVVLTGPEGRHAATVRRLRPGEPVVLVDGHGAVAEGLVGSVGAATLSVRVTARRAVPAPVPRLVVAQAVPKGDRAELAVELLTELGADEILPWQAERCVVRWDAERAPRALSRWRATALAAGKQSRRAWFPTVSAPVDTAALADRLAGATLAVVLHEQAPDRLAGVSLPAAGEVVVVVGPEGGIGSAELAKLGAPAYRLGDTVLRSSTAGAVALAVLLRGGRGAAPGGLP